MAKKNSNLSAAKAAKNDEFYTRLDDIQQELKNYRYRDENGDLHWVFEGKTVYLNCDDCFESQFTKQFIAYFNVYKLKRLICTCYNESAVAGRQLDLWSSPIADKSKKAYCLIIDKLEDVNGDGFADEKDILDLVKRGEANLRILDGDGDFRSPECIELLKEADIVVTNPPFSLFRDFIATMMEYGKQFAVIGNMNAITYKEIFPLIKDNKLWLGYSNPKEFVKPNGELQIFGNIKWFTNIPIQKRRFPLLPDLWRKYYGDDHDMFPKYDNYDAINVDKVADIPVDYFGVMGVPITFLDKYNPEEFEIVAFRKGDDGKDLVFTAEREREFNRTFVSLLRENKLDTSIYSGLDEEILSDIELQKITPVEYFHPITTNLKNGMINNQTISGKKGYCRMLIRRKANS